MCECPAQDLKEVCGANGLPQGLSFLSWPPHCQGDQQQLPTSGAGIWPEQASLLSLLPSRVDGPVGLRAGAHSASAQAWWPCDAAGGKIIEKGVTTWQLTIHLCCSIQAGWGLQEVGQGSKKALSKKGPGKNGSPLLPLSTSHRPNYPQARFSPPFLKNFLF